MKPATSDHASETVPTVANRPLAVLVMLAVAVWLIRQGSAPQASPRSASVPPGINAEFTDDLDVEKWIDRFEGESREVYEYRDKIVADLNLPRGAVVADVGAGTGFFSLLFAEAVGPEGKVYALDIAPEFIELIRRRAAEAGLKNVEAVRNAERHIDLPAESVDLVFICDTYHHFEYYESMTVSIHRALRPGGRVAIIDFRRIEGESRQWVLDHVRAGQDVVTDELIAAGFQPDESPDAEYLGENYFIIFRKPAE